MNGRHSSNGTNGGTWVRWAAGIAATVLLALIGAVMAWMVNQITVMQETMQARTVIMTSTHDMAVESKVKVDTMVEAVHGLRTEMALLGQEMRLERMARENKGR